MVSLDVAASSVAKRYAGIWAALSMLDRLEPTRSGRGRHRRAAFVVRVNDAVLFRRLDRIRAALAGFPFAVPAPDHALSLPVLELGGVAARTAQAAEVSQAELPGLVERARAIVAESRPFVVDLGHVNARADEVFAEVSPAEPLLVLHERLRALGGSGADEPYLPRFPLARFRSSGSARLLAEALAWFHDRPIGRLRVESVTLVVVSKRPMQPWLERVGEARLGG